MTPRNGNRTTPPVEPGTGKSPLQWFADKLESLRARRPPPTVRIPRRTALKPAKVRWWSSFWAARLAVRAGIPAEDFLRHRLSQRLGALPVSPGRLPVSLSIEEGGAVACHPNDPSPRYAPWLESFLRAEGPSALGPEIHLAQAEVAHLAARIEAQRERVDDVARHVEETARTTELVDPDDPLQARQMGRPPVPFPFALALQLFALALLLAQTWQVAMPCLEAAGVRSHELSAELRRNPGGVAMGSLFALGASVSLFVLAHLALRRGLELFDSMPEPRRRPWRGALATGAGTLVAVMAWSIAAVRTGAHRPLGVDGARATLFLVALAIPVITAWILLVARRLQESRAAAVVLARRWDQEHYRSLAEASRRAAALALEESRLAQLEADRAAAGRRLRALQQRVASAERLAADAADVEEQELALLAQGVVAALELDRYEYVRQAAVRGAAQGASSGPALAPEPSPVRSTRGEVGQNLGLAG